MDEIRPMQAIDQQRYYGRGYIGALQFDLDRWAGRPVCPFDKHCMNTSYDEVMVKDIAFGVHKMLCDRAECPKCSAVFLRVHEYWHCTKRGNGYTAVQRG